MPGNAHGHFPFVDQGHRSVGDQRLSDPLVQERQVFAVAGIHREAVAPERGLDAKPLHVVAGVSGDGHVVVVDEQLDVEPLGHGVPGGFGIAAFLLRAVAAEQDHGFVRVGGGHAVDMAPQVTQPAGAEEDALVVVPFGMAVEAAAEFAVVQQRFGGLVPVEHRHHVLDGDPVAGLVEIHGIDRVAALHETVDDQQLRNDVVGASGMTAQALWRWQRR